jgi:hypothetical protein
MFNFHLKSISQHWTKANALVCKKTGCTPSGPCNSEEAINHHFQEGQCSLQGTPGRQVTAQTPRIGRLLVL